MTDKPAPPKLRSFGLNSREFYDAVTPPPDPWRWGPGLPREPRTWNRSVVIESSAPERGGGPQAKRSGGGVRLGRRHGMNP